MHLRLSHLACIIFKHYDDLEKSSIAISDHCENFLRSGDSKKVMRQQKFKLLRN
jgi:hypothetical protein